MVSIRVQEAASLRIDEIYRYSRDRWGVTQADAYIIGLFETFAAIGSGHVYARPVPPEFGIEGYFCRCEKYYVYWKKLGNGDIGIATILHERMHQIDRFRGDFENEPPPP